MSDIPVVSNFAGEGLNFFKLKDFPNLMPPPLPPTFEGVGTLSGIVDLRGIILPNAIVELFEEDSKTHVASTTTDETGRYTFSNLSTTNQFFIVVKEPSGEWEYRISSRRTPAI